VESDETYPLFIKLDLVTEGKVQWPLKTPSGHTVLDYRPLSFWNSRRSYLFAPAKLTSIVTDALAWISTLAPKITNLIPTDQALEECATSKKWWKYVQIAIRAAWVASELEKSQFTGGPRVQIDFKKILGEDTNSILSPLLLTLWGQEEKAAKSKITAVDLFLKPKPKSSFNSFNPSKTKKPFNARKQSFDKECYKCGQKGHLMRTCPKNTKKS